MDDLPAVQMPKRCFSVKLMCKRRFKSQLTV